MLLLVTLAFNFIGDALRDFYDPYNAIFKRRKKISKKIKEGESLPPASHSVAPTPPSPKGSALKNPEASATNSLISVQDLHVSFHVLRGTSWTTIPAARGVSFEVNKGEILGLVGESGSGKSVSTTAIPGLLPQNAECTGHIYYKGIDLLGLSQKELREYRGQKIAIIFQEPGRSYDPLQNIGSIFFETFRILEPKITREEADKKTVDLLTQVGIPEPERRLKSYPHQFSGGQLQRVGIALALAQNCELLIADEPTTALDVTIQAQIISLLLKLKQERNLSIIFISHNINLVAQISDRIAVMYQGQIIETGSSQEVIKQPKHPYTQKLVSSLIEFGSHYTDKKETSNND